VPLTKVHWYYLPINPVQWEVGELSVGRRNGKYFPRMGRSENLYAFQQEVREWFAGQPKPELIEGDVDVYFWFWQKLETYEGPSGRKVTKKAADATNMQKATEDALQKILFDNDRQNRRVGSEIVEQGPDVNPGIIIKVCAYVSNVEFELPGHIMQARLNDRGSFDRKISDNTWPPSGGF
jgi:Holliday junction resolvase RusA-like endonuclease